jgi:hypothetical protein
MRRIVLVVFALAACREPAPAKLYDRPEKTAQSYKIPEPPLPPTPSADSALPIPARNQGPGAPKAGWCGETAIQEALLHLGVYAPQRLVNAAGHPTHPDLYSPDIPVALTELGVRFTPYVAKKAGFDPYADFLRSAIDEGDPVIAGVKILPTEHPEWGLDHFVLVVGHGEKGFLVNTTWGRREWIAKGATEGLAFGSANYALRMRGMHLPSGATPARAALLEELVDTVKLHVACTHTVPGVAYRMERRAQRTSPAIWSEDVTEKDLEVDADAISRFQCIAITR